MACGNKLLTGVKPWQSRQIFLLDLSYEVVFFTMFWQNICVSGVKDMVEHLKNSCYFFGGVSF